MKTLNFLLNFVIFLLTNSKENSLMEALKRDFWKYAATVGGPVDIEDTFLVWAANKKMAFKTAVPLWSSLTKDICSAFGQRFSDDVTVELRGKPEDIESMFGKGLNIPNTGVLEQAKDTIESDLSGNESKNPTLMDLDKYEDEAPTADLGVPPIPTGEPSAGAPPPTGAPPLPATPA